jgi:hypothetical protein
MLIAFALIILYISSSSSALSSQQDILWARNILPESVKISAPIAEQLPRISVDQLNLPKYSLFKERGKPFILTGALDQFPAMQKWPIPSEFMNRSKSWQDPYLAQLFPRNVADFYPYNMLISESRPTLFRFARVLRELAQDSELFTDLGRNHLCPEINGCKYVHLALSARNWDRLEELGDIPKKRHAHIDSGKWWQRRCLKENDVLEEYQIKTHWRSILIRILCKCQCGMHICKERNGGMCVLPKDRKSRNAMNQWFILEKFCIIQTGGFTRLEISNFLR